MKPITLSYIRRCLERSDARMLPRPTNTRGRAAVALVLVNGRRWVKNWLGSTDLNTIPVSVIERVEILKDGASAIYGSDAVGGVINIILRKDFDIFLKAQATGTALAAASAPSTSVKEIKIIGLRRIIAERMSSAKREIPHFAYVEEIDITGLEALRKQCHAILGEVTCLLTPTAGRLYSIDEVEVEGRPEPPG